MAARLSDIYLPMKAFCSLYQACATAQGVSVVLVLPKRLAPIQPTGTTQMESNTMELP